jgi:cholest-4-en-3-one 26-monooxygenase
MFELMTYFMAMAEDRKETPREDIVTKLVNARIDGEDLTSDEFAFFTLLLAVAGNETTRNAISHGIVAFMDHPDQWEIYKRERPETAADEIVRWTSPVVHFFRTATADTELAGVEIAKDDRMMIFFGAANRDPRRWEDPDRFDITRKASGHLAFGLGIHSCVGKPVARIEGEALLGALARKVGRIELDGEPRRHLNNTIRSFESLPVAFHAP